MFIPEITFERPAPYLVTLLATVLVLAALLFLIYRAGGWRELKKIWCDIHINPATGSYSQKRLMMSFAFFSGLFICLTQAFTIKIYPVMEFNSRPDTPLWVPLLLFIVALGATAATLLGHLNARKTTDQNGNPLTPPYTTEPELEPDLGLEDSTETIPTEPEVPVNSFVLKK